jgi:general secretion pathway protein I
LRIESRLRGNNESGFTLLEVMIAMAIMLVAFSSILAIQASSLKATMRSRQTHEVSMLARWAMAQTEVEIAGKKFNEISEETSGQFADPYQDYTWVRKVKEVQFPNLAAISSQAGEDSNRSDEGNNSQMMEQMGKIVTNYLGKSIREVSISVQWKRGTTTQSYDVAMYWVDLNSELNLTP